MHTSNHLKSIKLPTIIGNGVELVKENSGTRDFCTHIQKNFFFFFFFFCKRPHTHLYNHTSQYQIIYTLSYLYTLKLSNTHTKRKGKDFHCLKEIFFFHLKSHWDQSIKHTPRVYMSKFQKSKKTLHLKKIQEVFPTLDQTISRIKVNHLYTACPALSVWIRTKIKIMREH